jgi:high-affinity nickel permease
MQSATGNSVYVVAGISLKNMTKESTNSYTSRREVTSIMSNKISTIFVLLMVQTIIIFELMNKIKHLRNRT